MSELVVSWQEYHASIEQLAHNIHQSGWEFNQILCLAKGGLRVGDILARIFDQPLAVFNVSSYAGAGNRERRTVRFADAITNLGALGDRLLLLDDLVDSGESVKQTIDWLKTHSPHIQEIRTGVIWYKENSHFKPDYYAHYLTDNPWIQQPFEHYETFQFTPENAASANS
jgi:hypoxanthine phosphoribosyltransferase